MANVALIILSVIFAILIIISSIYFLVYFQHPDDKLVAWFPKFIVVTSLSLAAYNIFLLPLDIANQRGSLDDNIDMFKVCLAFFITTCIIVIVLVPFTIFFYEGADDSDDTDDFTGGNTKSQMQYAMKWTLPTIMFAGTALGIFWYIGGYAYIPVTVINGFLGETINVNYDFCSPKSTILKYGLDCSVKTEVQEISVHPLVYLIALVAVVGQAFFSVFGGVGLVSFPFDNVLGFMHRPKPIGTNEYNEKKKILGEQAKLLMDAGKQIQEDIKSATRRGKSLMDRSERKLRARETEFRKDVLILEYHYRWLEDAYHKQGGNFIWQLACFIFGLVGGMLSLFWVLHMLLYVVPRAMGYDEIELFLNQFFEQVGDVPFIGVAFYALFSFYLLVCVVKGLIKFGMRLLFFPIHPVKPGETFMNSLLFNAGIVLLCSVAVTQFLTLSFLDYAAATAMSGLFNYSIQNLKGLNYVWDLYIYILLSFFVLTLFFNVYRPYKRQRENQLLMQFK